MSAVYEFLRNVNNPPAGETISNQAAEEEEDFGNFTLGFSVFLLLSLVPILGVLALCCKLFARKTIRESSLVINFIFQNYFDRPLINTVNIRNEDHIVPHFD